MMMVQKWKSSFFLLLCILFISQNTAFSVEIPLAPSNPTYNGTQPVSQITPKQTQVQTPTGVAQGQKTTTSFEDCVRTYNVTVENLFFLTLAAINAHNYKIDEIQSRTGYISFEANGKMFLASITLASKTSSTIKITPMDNSYAFPLMVIERIFEYLAINTK